MVKVPKYLKSLLVFLTKIEFLIKKITKYKIAKDQIAMDTVMANALFKVLV